MIFQTRSSVDRLTGSPLVIFAMVLVLILTFLHNSLLLIPLSINVFHKLLYEIAILNLLKYPNNRFLAIFSQKPIK